MNKKIIVLIVALVIVIGAGILYAANHNSSDTNMNMGANQNNSNGSKQTATNNVTVQNFAFSPADITVKQGTTVTWTNKDSTTHTVTETDGQTGPSSGDLATGKSYSFTYNTVGTFKYHCSIHPDMLGTVTVTAS